jgi:hypothetical protein
LEGGSCMCMQKFTSSFFRSCCISSRHFILFIAHPSRAQKLIRHLTAILTPFPGFLFVGSHNYHFIARRGVGRIRLQRSFFVLGALDGWMSLT